MTAPAMPAPMRRALADLVRFGSIKIFGDSKFAASQLHLPELALEPKAVAALLSEKYAKREADGSLSVTEKARKEWAALEAAAAGAP